MAIDIAAGLRKQKIDVHAHIWPLARGTDHGDYLLTCADRLGISELWCSRPITGGRLASPDEVRAQNDAILAAMEKHPTRIRGMCFVIPGHFDQALAEINRCLDAGMIGIKLYNQYKIQDPAVWPIIELAIERNVPILVHAGRLTSEEDLRAQPLISHGKDFVEASERYPEAVFIHGHIGGGGDWEFAIRALRDASPNVYVDTSGSNLDDGQVEYAVRLLGIDRVLFATDNIMEGGVGKVLGAKLTPAEKDRIFWHNAARILEPQGKKPLHEWKGDPKGGEVA